MGQQASGGGGGQQDSGLGPVWLMVFFFIVAYLIWYYGHEQIVRFIFSFNLLQAKVVSWVVHSDVVAHDIAWMETLDPAGVEWQELVDSLTRIGNYTRYLYISILLIFAVVLFQSDITRKYKTLHNMKTLRAQEQKNWPCIMPVIKEDLAKTDINTGVWAMALNPLEFSRKYNLLKREDPLTDALKSTTTEVMTAGIRRIDAKRVFTLQLGALWEGIERCPPHVQALAAVFMARMNRDREGANLILNSLDKSVTAGKPDYQVAMPILNKHKNVELVQEVIVQHAYVLTVMAALLQASRQDGVVPSSEFLWLKTVDRRLWYMLNCVGRQTPYVEVAGPFAHWKAERAIGRKCLVPMIDEAIKALEIAVKEVKLSPKELQQLEA